MNNKAILEVCADSVESALIAQSAGAHRIELCVDLNNGGITPSVGQISLARKLLNIPLYVLIRPRAGDFLYSSLEFETMKRDVHYCGQLKCDGVVLGMLCSDGGVDEVRCSELVETARNYSMGVTFHRAFDRCSDMNKALESIVNLGFERILTSGGRITALEGIDTIIRLRNKAVGQISIMPGSGITPDNIAELINRTGLSEFHGSFRSLFRSSMSYKNPVFEDNEYLILRTAKDKVVKALEAINGHTR